MHPAIIQDHPGECPICGMTLVPKTDAPTPAADAGAPDAVAGLAPIDLSPDRIQLTGMKTARAERKPLQSDLTTIATVAPSERGLASINVRFPGWVQKLFVSETGRTVRRGEPLASIYSPDVLRAQQEFITARRWAAPGAGASPREHDLTGANLAEDARRRLELLGIAPQEIEEIARSGEAQRALPIRSPVAGTVIRRGAVEGSYVQPGAELFAVADLGTVWAIGEIYERNVARVRVGQPATLELAAFPGQPFKGKVSFLYPVLDPASRTMRIRVELRNPGGKLRPGMYGTLRLDMPAAEGIVVSAEALVDTGEAQYVFVSKPGGRFEPRRVKPGARAGDEVEIVEGLAEGETVVTTGNFLIDSESRLRAALQGR
jgi:Cu(I)/Ag(I) efflux system membrane fusion protein